MSVALRVRAQQESCSCVALPLALHSSSCSASCAGMVLKERKYLVLQCKMGRATSLRRRCDRQDAQ